MYVYEWSHCVLWWAILKWKVSERLRSRLKIKKTPCFYSLEVQAKIYVQRIDYIQHAHFSLSLHSNVYSWYCTGCVILQLDALYFQI